MLINGTIVKSLPHHIKDFLGKNVLVSCTGKVFSVTMNDLGKLEWIEIPLTPRPINPDFKFNYSHFLDEEKNLLLDLDEDDQWTSSTFTGIDDNGFLVFFIKEGCIKHTQPLSQLTITRTINASSFGSSVELPVLPVNIIFNLPFNLNFTRDSVDLKRLLITFLDNLQGKNAILSFSTFVGNIRENYVFTFIIENEEELSSTLIITDQKSYRTNNINNYATTIININNYTIEGNFDQWQRAANRELTGGFLIIDPGLYKITFTIYGLSGRRTGPVYFDLLTSLGTLSKKTVLNVLYDPNSQLPLSDTQSDFIITDLQPGLVSFGYEDNGTPKLFYVGNLVITISKYIQ